MRGLRWLTAIVLVAMCLPLVGCSSPTTNPPPKSPDPDKDKIHKPSGEIG